MTIDVTFKFNTAAEAAAFLQDFDSPTDAVADAPAAPTAGRPRGRPRKEVAAAAAAAAAAPVDPTPPPIAPGAPPVAAIPATPAPATPSAAAVPFAALVDPLTKLADVDLDKAMAILAKYGVKKASELKADQFGAVLAEVNAALAVPAKQSLI